MINKLIIILTICSTVIASEGKWFTSKNTSFGIGDEKFGLDFFICSEKKFISRTNLRNQSISFAGGG